MNETLPGVDKGPTEVVPKQRKITNRPLTWGADSVAARTEEVRRLTEAGWTVKRIAERLHVVPRTITDYRRRARMEPVDEGRHTSIREAGAPKPWGALTPEVRERLRDTPEAFRAFCDYYWSEQPMPAHIFGFMQDCYDYEELKWRGNVLLTVPPGHGKSTYFSVRMTIWRICQNRGFRRVIVSATAEAAKQFVAEIAQELGENLELLEDFGRFQAEKMWQVAGGALRVEGSGLRRGYNVFARGGQTQIKFIRCDEVVVDDPIGPEDVLTIDRRDKTLWWFHNVIESRPDPGGRIFVIMTREHNDDLAGSLSQISAWTHINHPAIVNEESKLVLWDCVQSGIEHRDFPRCCRNLGFLTSQRAKMGMRAFLMTYQGQAIPEGSALVQHEWIQGPITSDDPKRGCLDRERSWGPQPLAKGTQRIVAYDPSGGRGYAGMVVADVGMDRNTFRCEILELWRRQGAGLRVCLEELDRIADQYHPWGLVVEMNLLRATADLNLFDQWSKKWSIRVLEHTTSVGTKEKPGYGIEALSVDFEFGRIRLPYGDFTSRMMSQDLIKEATEYIPKVDTGGTDDLLHALWFIKNNLTRISRRGLYQVQTVERWASPLAYKRAWEAV